MQRDSGDNASFYIIDLIDLEQVAPPLTQPSGCVSIVSYGATANDNTDDTAAIQAAVRQALGPGGLRTRDIGGQASTVELGEAVARALEAR